MLDGPDLEELYDDLTTAYNNKVKDELTPQKFSELEKKVWEHFSKQIPYDKFGSIFFKNRASIIKALKNTKKWWEEEYSEYEMLILDAVERVIQGAKEDLATERGDDDFDPYDTDIEEEDLDDQELWQWWPQEWHHNVQDRHWISKLIKNRNIELHDLKYYGLEDAVQREYCDPVEREGNDLIDDIENVYKELTKILDTKRVMKWVFGDEREPIEWRK
jgi:hypothetical protein